MLNPKVLTLGIPATCVVGEMGQRLDVNNFRGDSARNTHCMCEDPWVRGLGPENDEGVPAAVAFFAQDSHQEGT